MDRLGRAHASDVGTMPHTMRVKMRRKRPLIKSATCNKGCKGSSMRMESGILYSSLLSSKSQPGDLVHDTIQQPKDVEVSSDTASVVTHGALLKSYDLNKRSMLPLAFLITPIAPQPSLVLQREPLRCRSCSAAFSYASAFGSFQQMRWQCAFCHTSNRFTSASYSPSPEYSPAMSCVEYVQSHINTDAPAVLCAPTVTFCVDGNLKLQEMLQV